MSAVSQPAADAQLKDAIKRQVEFYFSRSNLANDAFFVSQMNSQMYVPIETIIAFAKIKQLTSNTALVVEAIADSQVVVLNETKDAVKPNIKSERNTIILREIPSATKPEDVQSIFDGCGDVVNVRSDVGDTWFVTLSSEEEAVKTLLALRSKTFNDAPIKARLKSENAIKSFFPTQTVEPVIPHVNAYARGYYAAAGTGYYDNYGVQYANNNARGQQPHHNDGSRYGGNHHRQGGRGAGATQPVQATPVRVDLPQQQHAQPSSQQVKAKSTTVEQQLQQQPRPASRKAKDKKAKATAAHTPASQQIVQQSQPNGAVKKPASATNAAASDRQPVLNASNFPPLPATENTITAPQYEEIRHHYAHDDILEIVKQMDDNDCKLPDGKLNFTLHAVALTPTAHPDLLRNQRTYSIEQAREALRQGRPLRSDSIGSIGSIDYESMMYGEDYTHEARALRKQKAEGGAVSATSAPASTSAAKSSASTSTSTSVSTGEKKSEGKTQVATDAGKPTTPKVFGYAAAVIHGTPTPQPSLDKTKASPPFTIQEGAKTPKSTTKEEKKPNKNAAQKEEKKLVVDESLPKSGAWGGRGFLDVVKTEPPNAVPPPVVVTPAAVNKQQDRRNKDVKDNKDSKENRDKNHNHHAYNKDRRLSPPIPTRAAEDKW